MSEDVLTSESPWPELAELDDFWDADATPPRGVPRLDLDGADDDPTPVNAPRPAVIPTLPPPSTPAVAGPPPVALAEPLSLPTGAPLAPPPPVAVVENGRRRWTRRIGAVAVVVALVAAGAFTWQWNERRHEAASAASILPSESVVAPDWTLIEFDVARTLDVSVQADLETGATLGIVSGGVSILHLDDAFWTQDAGVEEWTPASDTFLARYAGVVELIEGAGVVTVTDVFPEAVHRYLDVVDDRSVDVPAVVPVGPTVVDVRNDATIRQLTLRVDRDALMATSPSLARRLGFVGEGPVDVVIWVDRAGVIWRVSAPSDVTVMGGEYRLVAATTGGPGPLDAIDAATLESIPPAADSATTDAEGTSPESTVSPTTVPPVAAPGDV